MWKQRDTMQRRFVQTYDVFVGNLPQDCDQKKIGKIFTKFGEITAVIVRDSNTEGKKLAYVKFLCEADANRAVEESRGLELEGSKVIVRRSDQRKKPGTSGGGNDLRTGKDDGQKPQKQWAPLSQKEPDLVSSIDTASNSSRDSLEELVMVTHVETPITLWVHTVNEDNMKELLSVTEQLSSLCPAGNSVSGTPDPSKIYAAKFSEDGQWYRCQVKNALGTERVKVQYVDYGNVEELNPNTMVEIPHLIANAKPFALKLVLNNTRANDLHDKRGIEFLKQITEGKYLKAVLTRKLADQSGYYADVYCDTEHLNEKLIQDGYATKRVALSNKQGWSGYGSVGMGEKGGGYGERPSKGFGGGTGTDRSGGESSNQIRQVCDETGKLQVIVPSINNKGLSHNSRGSPDHRQDPNVKRELDRLRSDKEMLVIEVANLKKRMHSLQSEYSAVSSKVLESSLTNQVHTAIGLAGKVKKLRCQLPVGRPTPLDSGIALAQSKDRICNSTVKSLPSVVSALSTYRAAQKEICMCKDMNELDEMVATRNEARKLLRENLKKCVEELKVLPLSDRGSGVKGSLDFLRTYYDTFFNYVVHAIPPLETIIPTFVEWREKKLVEFMDSRKLTDACQQAVLSSFSSIQKQLTLDESREPEKLDFDLDALLKRYMQVLQHEIAVTDAEHSRDAGFLSALVQALQKELQSEMTNIDNLTQLLTEFSQMKEDIEPWLELTPSVEELQEVRKTLRGHKSRLRHKIADREDLEESENDEGLLADIKNDIGLIRSEIHEALTTEDKLMAKLGKIADAHFPELLPQHPDLGIDIYLANNGLVKPSVEIEHYHLNRLPGCGASGLFESTFNQKPVLIREHLLSDGEHLSKENFISQVVAYSNIHQEHLRAVDAVFFDKNARHAYVRTKKDGELLADFVEQGKRPSKKAAQKIAKCVTEALLALHAQMIHGEVNPQNIMVREDGSAVLLEPDFSRPMHERCKKRYVSKSGMEFIAPDVKNKAAVSEVTAAIDLYSLGALLLWLHFPDVHFGQLPDGAPDYTAVPLEQPVQVLLTSLLTSLPQLRAAAELLLQSEYFTMEIPDEPQSESPTPEDSSFKIEDWHGKDVMSEIGAFDCMLITEDTTQYQPTASETSTQSEPSALETNAQSESAASEIVITEHEAHSGPAASKNDAKYTAEENESKCQSTVTSTLPSNDVGLCEEPSQNTLSDTILDNSVLSQNIAENTDNSVEVLKCFGLSAGVTELVDSDATLSVSEHCEEVVSGDIKEDNSGTVEELSESLEKSDRCEKEVDKNVSSDGSRCSSETNLSKETVPTGGSVGKVDGVTGPSLDEGWN